MNDNCITKVVGFRGITMESLVRRYIVTKGQEKPLLDACVIFPREHSVDISVGFYRSHPYNLGAYLVPQDDGWIAIIRRFHR